MALLYSFLIRLYSFIVLIFSTFNKKARLWISGRKNIFKRIEALNLSNEKIAWIHTSSLGEFEQAIPFIEGFKKKFSDYKIFLTFFSPSGYEIKKDYEFADYVFYLPSDTIHNAKKFVKAINPELAVFVKYDFWYNYFRILNKKNIPVYYISAIFRDNQYFFKWYGKWFLKILKTIKCYFVQNEESAKLLQEAGINDVVISGDTRFDRVYEIAKQEHRFPEIEKFINNETVFIAGSSWPPDESLLISLINEKISGLKFIIAPHETEAARINSLIGKIPAKALKYSEIEKNNPTDYDVLIIDCIGILSKIYRYAKVVYIGGGFTDGIHNIQEPAIFGKPVIFGQDYHSFQEAVDLLELGGTFCIKKDKELINITKRLLSDEAFYKQSSEICRKYTADKTGATERILGSLGEIL